MDKTNYDALAERILARTEMMENDTKWVRWGISISMSGVALIMTLAVGFMAYTNFASLSRFDNIDARLAMVDARLVKVEAKVDLVAKAQEDHNNLYRHTENK